MRCLHLDVKLNSRMQPEIELKSPDKEILCISSLQATGGIVRSSNNKTIIPVIFSLQDECVRKRGAMFTFLHWTNVLPLLVFFVLKQFIFMA